MQLAYASLPRMQLDAKRILATSGAISVHVAILMMLMMPAAVVTPQAHEEVIVIPLDPPKEKLEVIKPPEAKEKPKPTPIIPEQRTPPREIVEERVEPVDQTPGPMDEHIQEVKEPPNDFGNTGEVSPFQQLATDLSPAPPYPRMAVQRNIQGTVMLRIHVDAVGKPIAVSIEKSSGSRILDEAALKFVQARWHFVPAQSNGQAVDAWALVPIEFVLD